MNKSSRSDDPTSSPRGLAINAAIPNQGDPDAELSQNWIYPPTPPTPPETRPYKNDGGGKVCGREVGDVERVHGRGCSCFFKGVWQGFW
jgi:hypothetical protein